MVDRMTVEQIEFRLIHWARRHADLMKQYEALRTVTAAPPDCPLWRTVFGIWTAYTVAVSEAIGDDNEWLQWFEHECGMGRTPKEVSLLSGRKKFKVRTIKQLARVIHG